MCEIFKCRILNIFYFHCPCVYYFCVRFHVFCMLFCVRLIRYYNLFTLILMPIIYLRLLKKAIPAITGLSNRVDLLVEPKVFVRDLGRTEGCELAVLRRELNVRRQRMRRKNLSTGSIVRRRWHYPIVCLVWCLRHKYRRSPVDVSLRVDVLLLQHRSRRAS